MALKPEKGVAKPITTVYFRNASLKKEIEEKARNAGLSLSAYLISHAIASEPEPGKGTGTEALRSEAAFYKDQLSVSQQQVLELGREIRELTQQLTQVLAEARLSTSRGEPGNLNFNPDVVRAFVSARAKNGKFLPIDQDDLLRRLGVAATDAERTQRISSSVEALADADLIVKMDGGYRWNENKQ